MWQNKYNFPPIEKLILADLPVSLSFSIKGANGHVFKLWHDTNFMEITDYLSLYMQQLAHWLAYMIYSKFIELARNVNKFCITELSKFILLDYYASVGFKQNGISEWD